MNWSLNRTYKYNDTGIVVAHHTIGLTDKVRGRPCRPLGHLWSEARQRQLRHAGRLSTSQESPENLWSMFRQMAPEYGRLRTRKCLSRFLVTFIGWIGFFDERIVVGITSLFSASTNTSMQRGPPRVVGDGKLPLRRTFATGDIIVGHGTMVECVVS